MWSLFLQSNVTFEISQLNIFSNFLKVKKKDHIFEKYKKITLNTSSTKCCNVIDVEDLLKKKFQSLFVYKLHIYLIRICT